MKIGIGYANQEDAYEAGCTVAREALAQQGIDKPVLVIAFCAGPLDHTAFYRGLRSVVGLDVPIVGGSAIGIITNDQLSYKGFPAGAAILQDDDLTVRVAAAGGLAEDEYRTGQKVAGQLPPMRDEKLLLLFFDSIKQPATETTPPVMNASPPLIRAIDETLGPRVPIVGGGVIGDYRFQPTWQFTGDGVAQQSAVAALLGGNFGVCHRILHGCTLKDGIYHRITRMAGPFLYELDGRPIVEIIDELYGSTHWQTQIPVNRLALGINQGEKYGEFREENYVTRLIAGVLPERAGVVLFEPDLREGIEVQFMLRDPQTIIDSARRNTREMLDRIRTAGQRPLLGLYIDCAGRTAEASETLTEEAAEVQSLFRREEIPLLGFYSGVEIAPCLGKSRGLDWTGVLLVLTEG
jgi:hypothetical protein